MSVQSVPYRELLLQEKLVNFSFLWQFAKGFSAKIYFQLIGYRASGCGALGYHKLVKAFSAKIDFQAICISFLTQKKLTIQYDPNEWIVMRTYYIGIHHNNTLEVTTTLI